jgi:IS30 family transposase
MTQTKNNIDSQKGKHLSYAERCQIAVLKKEKYTNRQVSNVLNRAPKTINNEINRGSITQLKRQVQKEKTYDYYTLIYDADAGQTFYEEQRMNCGRRPKWAGTDTFIEWADDKMLKEKWSPDVVIGFVLKQELFDPSIIPCTSTLYQWIDRGVMRQKIWIYLKNCLEKQKKKHTENCRIKEY